jgi:pimeloyl-ACP methyl ester carboxylesterase
MGFTTVVSGSLMNTGLESRMFVQPQQADCVLHAISTRFDAVETRFFDTEGGTLAYDDSCGRGPLIIALSGMGELRQQYRFLRRDLCRAGYRVVTLDVRGQGDSSVDWDDYSARAAGRDVLALMGHLQATEAIVIGNSFAAGAAIWAAQLAPEKIRSMVLIGPIVRDLPMSPWIKALIKIGFLGPWRNAFWMHYWDSLFPARKPHDHASYRARLKNKLYEAGRMQALRTMVNLSKAGTEAVLERNRTPGLIVMGSHDADFQDPAQEAQYLARRLKARVVLAEGAGHYPHVEMPEWVGSRVVAFIEETLRT